MVKRPKTKKPKAGGLAALAKLPRQNEDEIDFPDPWASPGARMPPRPPGWKPRLPAPLPPQLRPRVGGRPLQDPKDKREARYAMRMHENLMDEIVRNARRRGWKASQWIEKVLIDAVNNEAGSPVVDAIGRYLQRENEDR